MHVPYFNYHATAKQLIRQGRLKDYYFTERHQRISPALVLIFEDDKHPIMPIRQDRWEEYAALILEHEKKNAKQE